MLYSFDRPFKVQPSVYEVAFPDIQVLRFEYRVVQLNRMNWRSYLKTPNPIAAALMTKMRIAPEDRAAVRLECLRMIATLKLETARMKLISRFVGTYLKLTEAEQKQHDTALAKLDIREQEDIMEILTDWEEKGLQRGLAKAALTFIQSKFGALDEKLVAEVQHLSPERLDALNRAINGFSTANEPSAWLATKEK